MIGRLSILTTSFIPGLVIADGITGAAAGVAAIAVKIIRRNK